MDYGCGLLSDTGVRENGSRRLRSRYCFVRDSVLLHSHLTTITCKIPEKLDLELEAVAGKRGVSKSAVVREAIEANLVEQRKRIKLSAYDVMKEACGIVTGGPRDLATNPKHMEGFGRD